MAELTNMQKRFVEEYLVDLNATQAAIRAGYSTHTAKDIGCENLAKPNIKAEVDKAMAKQSRRTGVTADRVIRELAKIAFVNVGDIVDEATGGIMTDLPEDDLAAVSGVKTKTVKVGDETFRMERDVKFHDKTRALELLSKHLGMLTDNINVNHTGDMSIVVGEPSAANDTPG